MAVVNKYLLLLVRCRISQLSFCLQQEENNNVPNSEHGGGSSNNSQKSAQVMVEMRSLKFTIAAANPLLAEKLAAPSGQLQQLHSPSSRSQLAPLIPKVEKGKIVYDL